MRSSANGYFISNLEITNSRLIMTTSFIEPKDKDFFYEYLNKSKKPRTDNYDIMNIIELYSQFTHLNKITANITYMLETYNRD